MNSEHEAQSRASHAESRTAQERFAENLRVETANAATPAAQVQPNAADVAFLAEVQGFRKADGTRPYETSAKTRADLEAMRVFVFSGQRIPPEVIENTRRAMRGEPLLPIAPTAQTPAPTESVGTPLERAQAQLDADGGYLDSDDWSNAPPEVQRELASGYTLDLSDGYVLQADDVAQLRAAKAVGISQAQVDKFVREIRRQQR